MILKPILYVLISAAGITLSVMIYGILVVNRTIPGDEMVVGILLGICFIACMLLFMMTTNRKKVKRRAFTPETKERVLNRQNHRCKICGVYPKNWNFDHIGSRGDNSAANCQALCLDCHADKTKREVRQSKKNQKIINEKPKKKKSGGVGSILWGITKDVAGQFTEDQTKPRKKRR